MEANLFEHNSKHESEVLRDLKLFLYNELEPACYEKVLDLSASFSRSEEPIPFSKKDSLTYTPIAIGERWSTHVFQCAWMHLQGRLPKGTSLTDLTLAFDCSGEALLVDSSGHALKGFTNGTVNFGEYNFPAWHKKYYPLDGLIDSQDGVDLFLDLASNQIQGDYSEKGLLLDASIVRLSKETQDIYYAFSILYDYFLTLHYGEEGFDLFEKGLQSIRALYGYKDPEKIQKSKAIVAKLQAFKGNKDSFAYTAVGHAHLDLLWLWPERETKRKLLRTFANQVYLAKTYPDYRYVVSQPRQLEWLEELDPELFKEVLHYFKNGQFEAAGGGYVENDTNLISEESMARQELYGQKYWLKTLGHYTHVRWLPDTFGYSAAIPQVLRLSEQQYFMTIKISWCLNTTFPYHTFHWEGIDGSQVLAHMPPEGDYNSMTLPRNLIAGEKNMAQSDGVKKALVVYGIGDGGAGPGTFHVEAIHHEMGLAYLPSIKMGNVEEFFHSIENQKLVTYQGEMYLENHQGTYTSQSENKQHNRRFEERMKSLEMMLAAKGIAGKKDALDALWKDALLYQFHDCLPGSSIKRVYDECDIRYGAMKEKMEALAEEQGFSYAPKEGFGMVNHLNYPVDRYVKVGSDYFHYQGEKGAFIQPHILKLLSSSASTSLETELYRLSFADDGHIEFVYSKKLQRNILEEANRLRVFLDHGDAWNIREDYRNQPAVYLHLVDHKVQDYGELFEVINHYSYKDSKVEETILIGKKSPLLEIHHETDWKNIDCMLRSESKPSVYSDTIHSDIQFGYLDRSTKSETEHERAQFECACQKWCDISSEDQGVSVLNAAKDGYYAKEGILSINLLRSTNYPCVDGDLKKTSYAYAFYPHEGGFDPIKIDELAMGLNARFLYGEHAYFVPTTDNEQIEVSCFKSAYDGKGFILRLYEKSGHPTQTHVHLPQGLSFTEETNLLEDKEKPVSGSLLTFSPFEIKTFRVQ